MNTMRIPKAKLAVVEGKIAARATHVVARLNDTHKVARERALATARQQKRRALKKAGRQPKRHVLW